jgi:hypothetical protein
VLLGVELLLGAVKGGVDGRVGHIPRHTIGIPRADGCVEWPLACVLAAAAGGGAGAPGAVLVAAAGGGAGAGLAVLAAAAGGGAGAPGAVLAAAAGGGLHRAMHVVSDNSMHCIFESLRVLFLLLLHSLLCPQRAV